MTLHTFKVSFFAVTEGEFLFLFIFILQKREPITGTSNPENKLTLLLMFISQGLTVLLY